MSRSTDEIKSPELSRSMDEINSPELSRSMDERSSPELSRSMDERSSPELSRSMDGRHSQELRRNKANRDYFSLAVVVLVAGVCCVGIAAIGGNLNLSTLPTIASSVVNKKGENWKYKMSFVDLDNMVNDYGIRSNLSATMAQLTDIDEEIISVTHCFGGLLVKVCERLDYHHQFLLLETEKYWYSIEKDMEAIILQRSEGKDKPLNKIETGERRKPASKRIEEITVQIDRTIRIRDVLDDLENSKQLSLKYNVLWNNCITFADYLRAFFSEKPSVSPSHTVQTLQILR